MSTEKSIIGYFAFTRDGNVACDGPACIIVGSYKAMKEFLAKSRPRRSDNYRILKTTYGEICIGMAMGAAYSFDAQSYGRFRPLAHADGINLPDGDFQQEDPGEVKLMTIFHRQPWCSCP